MASAQTGQAGRPAEALLPTTFAERGASVPFTTPQLAGARIRMSREGKLESVLPNPGGRGFYVGPWRAAGEICQPTAHDARLIDCLGKLSLVLPRMVRGVARAVTAEGFAGRAAMQAAKTAMALEAQARRNTHAELLLQLVDASENPCAPSVPLAAETPAKLHQRGQISVARLAEAIGCRADKVTHMLEDMADHFSPLGLCEGGGGSAAQAYVPQMAGQLAEMRAGLRGMAASADAAQVDLRLIADVIDVLLASVEAERREALALTQRMATLVRRWLAAPDNVQRQVNTTEWLLDGWDRIYALWRLQDVEKQRGLPVAEIAFLLPIAPASEKLSSDIQLPMHRLLQDRHRRAAAFVAWPKGGTPHDLIERNEALLALV